MCTVIANQDQKENVMNTPGARSLAAAYLGVLTITQSDDSPSPAHHA